MNPIYFSGIISVTTVPRVRRGLEAWTRSSLFLPCAGSVLVRETLKKDPRQEHKEVQREQLRNGQSTVTIRIARFVLQLKLVTSVGTI